MNAEEAKMLLKRLRDGVGQKSVALRCDCDNLEVVFITINENEGVCVTDGHRTFQYLNRGDNSTYIPIESLDLTIVQGICDDLSVEFKAAPEDGFQSIEYILNPSEQLSSAVERVAEAVDQIFKLAMRPDLK